MKDEDDTAGMIFKFILHTTKHTLRTYGPTCRGAYGSTS